MQKHIKNYLNHFKYSETDVIQCEVCHNKAVDIHHIYPRSSFGNKRKDEQDEVSNLIALCRNCHEKAHDNMKESRIYLTDIVNKR